MKDRLFALDTIRGIGILGVVIFHRLLFDYDVTFAWSKDPEGYPAYLTGLLVFFFIFLSMAGLFYIISGMVTTISFYKRSLGLSLENSIDFSKAMPRDGKKLSRQTLILGALFYGFYLIFFHFVYEFLLAPDFFTGDEYWYGLLIGGIVNGEFVIKSPDKYFRTTALLMIGIIIIVSTLVLMVLTIRGGKDKLRRNTMVLMTGILALLFSPAIFRTPLFDQLELSIQNSQPVLAFFYAILVRNQAPVLPYLAYGLIGVLVALHLLGDTSLKTIYRGLGISTILSFLVGGGGFAFGGGANLSGLPGYTQQESIGYTFQRFQELGLFFLILYITLKFIDFQPEATRKKRVDRTRFLRRFGMLSLTVYTFEALLAAIFRVVFTALIPGWSNQIGWVLVFVLVIFVTWYVILVAWGRVGYVGSLEWGIIQLLQIFIGKQSNKLNLRYLMPYQGVSVGNE